MKYRNRQVWAWNKSANSGFDVNKETRFRKRIVIDTLTPSGSDDKIITRKNNGELRGAGISQIAGTLYEGTPPCPVWVGVMTDNPAGALDIRGDGYFNGSLKVLSESGQYNFSVSYAFEVDGASSGQDLFLFKNSNGQLLKLTEDGILFAKEVRVRVPPFPDYVFTPNYDLMPLLELSLFIEKNGHLPKMPTQEKVAEEGVNVGELNVLLTEKVEELTLYTIEQERRIQELEEQVQKLGKMINQLNNESKN